MPKPTESASPREPTGTQSRRSSCARRAEYSAVLDLARKKLERDEYLRCVLPGGGRVHIDRRLPFLALYRSAGAGDPGTEQLVTPEASYLLAAGAKSDRADVKRLVTGICEVLSASFGNVLLLEVWSRPAAHPPVRISEDSQPLPGFRIFHPRTRHDLDPLLQVLRRELARKRVLRRTPAVEIAHDPREFAERVRPVFTSKEAEQIPCIQLGVEVEPIYQMPDGSGVYPGRVRALRTQFARALKYLFFEFARQYTSHRPKSYHALGRRAVVKAVWAVDSQLDQVGSSFDLLIESSPTNTEALWTAFKKNGFEKLPRLRYRPLPFDPLLTKRRLYAIPVERVEDPTIARLFREKQIEIDRQLTMLADRATPRFLLGSIQLYGGVSPQLLRSAEEILERVPVGGPGDSSGRGLKPEEFKERADAELAHYRRQWDGFVASSRFSRDVIAGLMVSSGDLLIAPDSRTPASRVDALLQHEVGTHLVTYYNGSAQRFTQLRSGLAGYEELQEGLAVIAEYLVGGMTGARLRTLAARVTAAKMLIDGAGPVDTFRLLCRYGFAQRPAFNVMLRLYRGGGLVKDAIYLRGLITILSYLREGGELEPLFVGKIAAEHIPFVQELTRRGVITPPKLTPRYLDRAECRQRLERVRAGMQVIDLIN